MNGQDDTLTGKASLKADWQGETRAQRVAQTESSDLNKNMARKKTKRQNSESRQGKKRVHSPRKTVTSAPFCCSCKGADQQLALAYQWI